MQNPVAMLDEFTELFLSGDLEAAITRTRQVLEGGVGALDFFEEVFTPAMKAIGEKFGRLDIFLPELLTAAEVARAVSGQAIEPHLQKEQGSDLPELGRVLIASVRGDLHDIGKNMVALMLEVNGFDVVDMGVDAAPLDIVERAKAVKADIIALSSLLTASMPYMKEVVEMLEGFGLKDQFAVIVGGAPITPGYSQDIGADAYGSDAIDGVHKCIELMSSSQTLKFHQEG